MSLSGFKALTFDVFGTVVELPVDGAQFGNLSLLGDPARHGGLTWDCVFAENRVRGTAMEKGPGGGADAGREEWMDLYAQKLLDLAQQLGATA